METPFSTVAYTEQYIEDMQAKDITDIIAKTDPTVLPITLVAAGAKTIIFAVLAQARKICQ